MLNITKVSPKADSLYSHHCQQTNTCYDNLSKDAKNALRNSLLEEQGFLCAYCMQRITADNMRIEHFISQESIQNAPQNRLNDLSYDNLLACCQGNEPKEGLVRPDDKTHCDVKKQNSSLSKILQIQTIGLKKV